MMKILSKYWGSMPMPLSRTAKTHSAPCLFAEIRIWGGFRAVEFEGVGQQVLEDLDELGGIPQDPWAGGRH